MHTVHLCDTVLLGTVLHTHTHTDSMTDEQFGVITEGVQLAEVKSADDFLVEFEATDSN